MHCRMALSGLLPNLLFGFARDFLFRISWKKKIDDDYILILS